MAHHKRRINVTINPIVHDEMKKMMDLMGFDFSEFVEKMSLEFITQMRPLARKLQAIEENGEALSPNEVKLFFMQLMGSVTVEAGQQVGDIVRELDIIEAEQEKKAQTPLFEPAQKKAGIHTIPQKKVTKKKIQK